MAINKKKTNIVDMEKVKFFFPISWTSKWKNICVKVKLYDKKPLRHAAGLTKLEHFKWSNRERNKYPTR